jgi:hypothetical protein
MVSTINLENLATIDEESSQKQKITKDMIKSLK